MMENKDMKELKEGWKKDKLENLTNYIARGIPPKYSENLNDMIVINQKCIRDGKLSLKDSRYHNYSLKKVAEEKILKKYDILINSTGVGTLGRVCQNLLDNENLIVDTHVTIVRPNLEKINPIYLGFAIRNNQKFIESLGEGSTGQTELKRQRLADEVEIFYPEHIETQEKIASILSALDDKIEINNEMNKTLEEMAQTLFKRWFIDFDFPNENGEPYRSSGGKMVDSELGEIPEGWEVKELKSFGETITGKTPSTIKKEYFGKDIPFIKTPDMHGNIFICEYENYLSNLGAESQHKKYVPENTVLMSCIGAKAGVVSLTTEKSQFNQQINGFIATNSYDAFYFYFALNLQKDNLRLKGSSGSTMININKNSFETHKYFYGDKNTMQNISKLFKPIFEKIKQNMIENNILKNKRDTLLPKLMSGEIEV